MYPHRTMCKKKKKKVAAKGIPSKGMEALCIMWARSAGELLHFHN